MIPPAEFTDDNWQVIMYVHGESTVNKYSTSSWEELPSLHERREEQTLRVFTRMTYSVNCLHHLINDLLRSFNKKTRFGKCYLKHFCWFIIIINARKLNCKNYSITELVFRNTLAKFRTFSAPLSNFRTFQVLKNPNSNFRTFQDPWEPWFNINNAINTRLSSFLMAHQATYHRGATHPTDAPCVMATRPSEPGSAVFHLQSTSLYILIITITPCRSQTGEGTAVKEEKQKD